MSTPASPSPAPSADAPVAIVTGGAGGIGSATATLLAGTGWRVASFDLTEHPGGGPGVRSYRVDLTDETAVESAVAAVAGDFGRIDALIACAAQLDCFAVHDTPLAAWERLFAVNVTGTFLAARACIAHLRRSPQASIVLLSSVHAFASIPRTAAYAATKGAVLSLARQMAVEYADDGIRVNALVPGSVDTAMSAKHGAAIVRDGLSVIAPSGQLGRTAQPEELAATIAFLVSPQASFITGAAIQADGGLLNRLM
jgi:NAD(P)-dependent dehydrogenase (short-subunit alcohol dehydrogenase family)